MVARRGQMLAVIALWLTCYASQCALRADDEKVEITFSTTYESEGGKKLRADIYRPAGPGPYPGVLCIHGGAWFAGHRIEMVGVGNALAKHGYVAVSIDYRLAPVNRFPAQLDDARAAFAWMQRDAEKLRLDPQRIGAWGYSAGAHLVTLLALTQTPSRPGLKAADDPQRIRAVVAGGTPSEFRQLSPDDMLLAFWLGGTRRQAPEVYEAASPAAFVSSDDPPLFYYHGETDIVVGITQPRRIVELLKEAGVPVSFYPRPGEGHIQTFLDGSTVVKGIEFLDRHLKGLAVREMANDESRMTKE